MSNIVTIVRNPNDTQVEINGREIMDVLFVCTPDSIGTPGPKEVTITFKAAQLNIVGVNAQRDTFFDGRDNGPKPLTLWQRFKAWWKRRADAFEAWQNGDYTDY